MADPYVFDLEFFQAIFPVVPVTETGAHLTDVCSPSSLVEIDAFRRAMGTALPISAQCPVDVFTWSVGDPPDRTVTKIGGLPYRTSDTPWPLSPSGAPRVFVAQFLFPGSVADCGDLPGSNLLIFADDKPSDDWTHDSFYLEWQQPGLAGLVAASELPLCTLEVPALFGVRYRTFDLKSELPTAFLDGVIPSRQYAINPPEVVAKSLAVYDATKIGGRPIVPVDCGEDRLLCTLISMYPRPGVLYPYVNREAPWSGFGDPIPVFSPGGGYFRLAITIDHAGRLSLHYHFEYC